MIRKILGSFCVLALAAALGCAGPPAPATPPASTPPAAAPTAEPKPEVRPAVAGRPRLLDRITDYSKS
jgi:hypothetical protein